MRISSIHIKNFRCLKDIEIPIENHTALVGSNGTGKSCFLKSLELFITPTLSIMKWIIITKM